MLVKSIISKEYTAQIIRDGQLYVVTFSDNEDENSFNSRKAVYTNIHEALNHFDAMLNH